MEVFGTISKEQYSKMQRVTDWLELSRPAQHMVRALNAQP